MSELPHRVRTWAPKGKTPVLQYSLTWNQLSAVAGVTFGNIYFKLVKGVVRAPEIVAFLKKLRRHLAPRKLLIIWDRLQAHRSSFVRDYVASEGGDIEQKLDAQVTAAATQAGLTKRHDLMQRTPNTFNAHRLIWLAEKEDVQYAMVEGLFSAYFVEGRDVGDKAVLAEVAAAAGIDNERAIAFLAGTEGSDEVSEAETASQRSGLNGVPT